MRRLRVSMAATLVVCVLVGQVCGNVRSAGAQEQAKHYHLHGKVVSIDQAGSKLNIDADDIPGFMDAMAMDYPVHDKAELAKVHPGDEINADLIVPSSGSYYVENIVVVKKK